jgi:peptide-methionine (S)-S-oxide reductase
MILAQRFPHFVAMSLVTCLCASCVTSADPVKPIPKPASDLPAAKDDESTRTAVLAMGCFWGTEAAFEQLKGVNQVVAGYAGGDQEHASYDKYEASNHAECVKITYDPHQITYAQLLQVFFTLGQPTVKDGQQPDMGHEYRMAVFYENDDQKRVAESYVQQLTADHVFDSPIAVTVENMPHGFFPAEEYHQHYVAQHPNESYVETVSMAKVRHIRDAFKDWVK